MGKVMKCHKEADGRMSCGDNDKDGDKDGEAFEYENFEDFL